MNKKRQIIVQGKIISISLINDTDFVSLTDMAVEFGGNDQIKNWIRTRRTVEFLGTWESSMNPDFNTVEFHRIYIESANDRFIMSPTQWMERTNAKGITAQRGRYGGTYAHKDIATTFAFWLSPQFQVFFVKEFQRLKETENDKDKLEWDYRRFLSKANYKIHTDAVKEKLIPWGDFKQSKEMIIYASEADFFNILIFGITAKQWREKFPEETHVCSNIRDCANSVQLNVLANLQSMNALLIRQGILDQDKRYEILQPEVLKQLASLYELIKDFNTIESPNKKKLLDEIANKESNKQLLSFGETITKIANAGKPLPEN